MNHSQITSHFSGVLHIYEVKLNVFYPWKDMFLLFFSAVCTHSYSTSFHTFRVEKSDYFSLCHWCENIPSDRYLPNNLVQHLCILPTWRVSQHSNIWFVIVLYIYTFSEQCSATSYIRVPAAVFFFSFLKDNRKAKF